MFFDFPAHWSGVDWGILGIYFAVLVVIGFVMKTQASKSFKNFFVAGRRLTIPIMVGVAAASWYDSWTVVGLGECGWTMGISVVMIYIIPCQVLRIPLALWIGPRTRDKIPEHVVTLPDLFRHFYNKSSGLISAVGPCSEALYTCALLFAVGQVIYLVSPMSMWASMIITGIIVVLYTALAGLLALAVTDVIQFMIMTVGAGIVIIGILVHTGSFESLWASLTAIDPNLTSPIGANSPADVFGWAISAAALYVNAQSYQRFGAAKTGGDIKISYLLVLIIGSLFSVAMVITGMAAHILYPNATSPAEGFWAVVFTVLPIGLRGLFVVALIAAVMSTISAELLIISGIVAKDVARDCFKKSMTDQSVIRLSRIVLIFLGVFMVAGTYLWRDGIGNAWNIIGGFQVAILLIPILAGFFWRKRKPMVGTITLLFNCAFFAVWQFALGSPLGIPSNVATWIAGGIVFVICAFAVPEKKNAELKAS
jgi:SSS family solute:Na+ symporter